MKRLLILLFAASSLTAVGQVPDYVPTEGLVGYYTFDGNLQDASGAGNNGSGSVGGFVEGLNGSAAQFTGNEIVDLPMSISFEQRSLAMWVRVESSGWQLIFSDDHLGLNHGNSLVGYGHPAMPTSVGIEFGTTNSRQESELASWIHVAAVRNADSTMYFFNGALASVVASDTYRSNSGVSNARIGADRTGGRKFTGSVDDLVIYDLCLSENQILGLFLLSIPQPGCTDASACNFNPEATVDDGSCIPSGCMDAEACNYAAEVGCDDGSCDYTCCPGPGCCSVGHYWDWEVGKCFDINPGDINLDGCVQLNDLLDLLSAYGDCGAEESPWQCGDALEYQGYDYETVQIGEQCWFSENLRSNYYSDGSLVESIQNNSDWANGNVGMICTYGNNASNEDLYGALYNWYAVADVRGLCPMGWHVPEEVEWQSLLASAGGVEVAGEILKSQEFWADGAQGNDSVGFDGRPGGYRRYNGIYQTLGSKGYWWTSAAVNESQATIFEFNSTPAVATYPDLINGGFSVRCIKDTE